MAIKIKINEKIVDIDLLVPNLWNPNEESGFMQEKLSGSLETFGQVAEVLARELPSGQYEIIDGEHRWNRMKLAGAKEILINNLGKISDDDAKMLTMVANELHGNRNPVKLAKILRELESEADWKSIASLMPYNDVELVNLLEIDPDVPEPPEFSSGFGERTGGSASPAKSWVDLKVSIHRDRWPEVEAMLAKARKILGVGKRPSKELQHGEILKKLVTISK